MDNGNIIGSSIKRFLTEKNLSVICLITVILIPCIWALLTFNKVTILSEGWYILYSKMILAGKTPYIDFDLVYPPLYTYIMTLIVSIFGESLIVMRVVGVFMFTGLSVVSYYLFKLMFPPHIAATAALFAIFILQSDIVNAMYDCSRFFDLFNYLTLYFILRAVIKLYRKEAFNLNLNMFLAGISCALAILFRQTSGVIIFVYFAIFLIFILLIVKNIKFTRKSTCCFFIGVLIPIAIMAVCLVLAGAFTPFVQMTLTSGVKGSAADMLFNWLPRAFTDSKSARYSTVISLIIALFFAYIITKKRINECPKGNERDYLLYYLFATVTAVMIFVLFFSFGLSSMLFGHRQNLLSPMFIFSTVIGVVLLYRTLVRIKKGEQASGTEVAYLLFCGFIFAVMFGSGTSSGLSYQQSALNFGFIIAIVLSEVSKLTKAKAKNYCKIAVLGVVVFILATSVAVKVVAPYDWWSLKSSSYKDANFGTDIDFFKGIKMDADSKFAYEDFVEKADIYLSDGDEIYCYPYLSSFYIIMNKVPTVKAPICWFDVSGSESVLSDLEYLKNNNPKMIVFADQGEYTLSAHELMFNGGEALGHRAMYEWLNECKDGGSYTVLIGDGKSESTYIIDKIHVYIMIRNDPPPGP